MKKPEKCNDHDCFGIQLKTYNEAIDDMNKWLDHVVKRKFSADKFFNILDEYDRDKEKSEAIRDYIKNVLEVK
jgi:hypothetical protein